MILAKAYEYILRRINEPWCVRDVMWTLVYQCYKPPREQENL